MDTIYIQVRSGDEWLKVTGVEYDKNREYNRTIGDRVLLNRDGALRRAFTMLTGWMDSHQFTGRELRVAERDWSNRRGEEQYRVITGLGG